PMLVTRLEDGLIYDVNPAFERWRGLSREQLINTSLVDDGQFPSAAERNLLIEKIKKTGSYSDYPFDVKMGDGEVRHCLCSAQVFNFDQTPMLVTFIKDITEQQRQQDSLGQSQTRLQILTDLEELLYQESDPDRVLQMTVEFLLERMKVDRAWMLSPCRVDAEFLEVVFEATHPDYPGASAAARAETPLALNDGFRDLISRHLDTAEPHSYGPGQDFPLPKPMVSDSNIRSQLVICLKPAIGDPWLLGLHQCSYDRNWSGADTELLKRVALRITDRLNTLLLLNNLQTSEQRFRELFESAPEAIGLFDMRTNRIIDGNPALTKMLGYTGEQLSELSVIDFSAEKQADGDAELLIEQYAHQANGSLSPQFEWNYIRADGTTVIAAVQLQKLAGHEDLLRVTAVDITERRRLEEQLQQAQKMETVGQLAGGIAHDFNNLLQGILGFSDLLLESPESSEKQRRQLRHIHEAATRAATLTNQLLAFGRRQVLDKKNININQLISNDIEGIKRVLGSHIELDFIPGSQISSIHSDPTQLQQILLNLYLNARDAMPDGGLLTVETENVLITGEYCRTHPWAKQGRYVLISVSDNGVGMDKNILQQIFEPFFTTKGDSGSGLGLAMVFGIIKQHDGMIQAYSEPGLGTTFKIYLPQSERPASTIGPKISPTVAGGGETILIAEDDPAIRDLVKTILERVGYQTIEAENGDQAVEQYRQQQEKIDLVLLDVIMPRLGGKQAYEKIRAIDPDARCLFTSGYSNNGVHTDFVLSHGLQLIQKPFTPSDLLRQIRSVLDR
ncbi:MAG: PAS domain S-box protein, partial [Gammaproteobacteria bacterium]